MRLAEESPAEQLLLGFYIPIPSTCSERVTGCVIGLLGDVKTTGVHHCHVLPAHLIKFKSSRCELLKLGSCRLHRAYPTDS